MAVVNFAGVAVDNVTLQEAVDRVEQLLRDGQPRLIVTPNPEIIVACQHDQELKEILNSADLRVPDGISLVVVSRLAGKPLKERVSGIDLMLKLIERLAPQRKKIFLLGGGEGVAATAGEKLSQQYPGIQVVGAEHGYFGDDTEVMNKVRSAGPDLLFVGLGAGRQERWLNRHLKELNVPVSVAIGGSLDVVSGRKKRAPRWTRLLYIEWLYRLVTEPRRWKRQLALPKFLWLTLFRTPPH